MLLADLFAEIDCTGDGSPEDRWVAAIRETGHAVASRGAATRLPLCRITATVGRERRRHIAQNRRPSRWPRSAWIGPAISPGARA
jgi:hypothetical protein